MSSIDGLSPTTRPHLELRAPDLAMLRDIVGKRAGWRLGRRQTPVAQELLVRLIALREASMRARSPRVRTKLSVFMPNGRNAVQISV